jgi:hypothetical protein
MAAGWILIVLWSTGTNNSESPTAFSVEFSSKVNCRNAGEALRKLEPIKYVCVEK